MKYDCNLIQDIMPLYKDGVLSEQSNKLIEGHLKKCSACRTVYGVCEQVAPKEFEKVNDNTVSIDEQTDEVRRYSERIRKRRMGIILSAVLALLIVVAVAVVFVEKRTERKVKEEIAAEELNVPVVVIARKSYKADIESLDLTGKKLSEEDLSNISQLTHIRSLNLKDTGIDNVKMLQNLTTIEHLDISDNPIEELTGLENMKKLSDLYAFNMKIKDISVLEGRTELKCLNIGNNEISDLSVLKDCDKLYFLRVDENPISDLSPISGLEKLSFLGLEGTDFTEEDIEKFKEDNSSCYVAFDDL